MGCSASQTVDDISPDEVKRKNTVVVKPKASISVGQGIGQNIDNDALRIVFIFGGPGCGKGNVVHNLVNTFNFKFISAELFILQSIAKQFNAGDATTSDLQNLINDNSFELTLNWVLSIIEEEIRKDSQHPILIDVIPNMKFLSKMGSLMKDCEGEMRLFEEKFPISFAINLSVKKEQLIRKTHKTHAAMKLQQKEDNKKNGPSDEVDTGRTYRRFKKYEESVRDFIDYFRESDRLLTVDTSSGRNDVVWESIKTYFQDSEFVPMLRPVELVLLFCFANEDVQQVDTHRYPMKELSTTDLVENALERNLLNILIQLGNVLKTQGIDNRYFIINLDGIDIDVEELPKVSKKALMFEEIAVGQLDYFIHKLRRKSKRRISQARKAQQMYKAILSTNNETLLFPSYVSSELCHQVALFLTNSREQTALVRI